MANRTRNIALAVLMLASAGWGYESTRASSATTRDEIWSFDMWCLEMRLYPMQRCDARRAQDVKDYELPKPNATARSSRSSIPIPRRRNPPVRFGRRRPRGGLAMKAKLRADFSGSGM